MVTVPKDMRRALAEGNGLFTEDVEENDADLAIAFDEIRHREKIEGSKKVTQTWRMKERVR